MSSRRRKVEETILTSTCNWQYCLMGLCDVIVNGKIAVNGKEPGEVRNYKHVYTMSTITITYDH